MWESGSCAVGVVAYGEPGHPYWEEVRDTFSPQQVALAATDVVDNCVTRPQYKYGGRVQVGRGVFQVFVRTNLQGEESTEAKVGTEEKVKGQS